MVLARCALALIAGAGCAPRGSLGTVPPPGADGQMDPAQVPDFVAVAGRGQGVAGYVAKEALGDRQDRAWPVYAADLRTVVGTLVPGKGFVPIGVDPDTVPNLPVVVGSAEPVRPKEPEGVLVYSRNASPKVTWTAVLVNGNRVDDSGIPGNGFIGSGCFVMPVGSSFVILDRYVADPAAVVVDTLFTRPPGSARDPLALDIDAAGHGSIRPGRPSWWDGDQPSC